MEQGLIRVFYGEGQGKSAAAIGEAVRAAIQGKSVIVIQFLKGRKDDASAFVQSLEPNIKWFSFEKEEGLYDDLPEEKKAEAYSNIQNGFQFARKVLTTKEADVLVLDEVLGLIDHGLIQTEDILSLRECMWESMEMILTGRCVDERIIDMADQVSEIKKVK